MAKMMTELGLSPEQIERIRAAYGSGWYNRRRAYSCLGGIGQMTPVRAGFPATAPYFTAGLLFGIRRLRYFAID